MIGYSYYGKIQLKVAIEQPPHLKAIFVSHVGADYVPRLCLFRRRIEPVLLRPLGRPPRDERFRAEERDLADGEKPASRGVRATGGRRLLDNPDIKYWPNLFHLLHYPDKNPNFFDMVMNPLDGPFWQDRSIAPFFNRIKVPALRRREMRARSRRVLGCLHRPENAQENHGETQRAGRASLAGRPGIDHPVVRPLAQGQRHRHHGRTEDKDFYPGC